MGLPQVCPRGVGGSGVRFRSLGVASGFRLLVCSFVVSLCCVILGSWTYASLKAILQYVWHESLSGCSLIWRVLSPPRLAWTFHGAVLDSAPCVTRRFSRRCSAPSEKCCFS